MDAFKIGDEIEKVSLRQRKNNSNKTIPIIIVIIVSILCGLIVFLISNVFLGKKDPTPTVTIGEQLDLNDENVQILYQYVTYGVRGTRYDKFIKEQNVTLESFSNYEKFYYALQFAQVEDFTNTGKINENKQKVYNISSSKIKNYMQRFFGNQVTYSSNSEITYPFSFRINNQNVGTLKYAVERDGFDTTFDGLQEDIISNNLVEPYYTKLTSASTKSDGSLELREKIIYTTLEQVNGIYNVTIYKDYQKTMPLEMKTNLTEQQLKDAPIKIDDYIEKASTITYTFKLNANNYYFDNSNIRND